MQLLNRFKNLSVQLRVVLVSVAMLFILLILIVATTSRGSNIDVLPTDSSETDYTKTAYIKDGMELFKILGPDKYDAFGEDLFVYAKKSIKGYKDKQKVVGFVLISSIDRKDNLVSFDGKFGSSNHTMRIVLKQLPNNRLETSITDSKTKTNINSDLPSNSPYNKYISKLPINGEGFMIDFNISLGTVQLFIYERNTTLAQSALDSIKKEIGESFIESSVNITFPQPEDRNLVPTAEETIFINDQGQPIYIDGS